MFFKQNFFNNSNRRWRVPDGEYITSMSLQLSQFGNPAPTNLYFTTNAGTTSPAIGSVAGSGPYTFNARINESIVGFWGCNPSSGYISQLYPLVRMPNPCINNTCIYGCYVDYAKGALCINQTTAEYTTSQQTTSIQTTIQQQISGTITTINIQQNNGSQFHTTQSNQGAPQVALNPNNVNFNFSILFFIKFSFLTFFL